MVSNLNDNIKERRVIAIEADLLSCFYQRIYFLSDAILQTQQMSYIILSNPYADIITMGAFTTLVIGKGYVTFMFQRMERIVHRERFKN